MPPMDIEPIAMPDISMASVDVPWGNSLNQNGGC